MPELTFILYAITAATTLVEPSMPTELVEISAFGLLVLIVIWHGRMMSKIVDRALEALDEMSETMQAIQQTLISFENRLAGVEEKLEEWDKIRRE